jgi:hypothetical protein
MRLQKTLPEISRVLKMSESSDSQTEQAILLQKVFKISGKENVESVDTLDIDRVIDTLHKLRLKVRVADKNPYERKRLAKPILTDEERDELARQRRREYYQRNRDKILTRQKSTRESKRSEKQQHDLNIYSSLFTK